MSKSNREIRAERAAAALAEMQRKEKRRNRLMVLGVVAIVVVIVAGGFLVNQLRGKDEAVSAPTAAAADTYGVLVGDKDAPHSVVVYEDFLCPFCGMFETASHADLAALAAQGKVYLDYRPFNLLGTDYSVAAASAFKVVLDASGSTVAKKFHDELYDPANQPSEAGPFPDADWLVQKAVEAGATEADVRQGIEEESQKGWVEDATRAAAAAKVRATPTILLDGEEFTDGATSAQLAQNLVAAISS